MKKEYDEILKKFNLNSDESGKIDFLDVESDDGKIRVESPIDKTFLVNIKKLILKSIQKKLKF
mgnify:CR=1 FL=1